MSNEQTFSLKGVKVNKLPERFKIDMNLDLRESSIVKLPNKMVIQGDLILNEFVDEIPEDIIIKGNLDMTKSNIQKLPSYFAIGGEVIGSKYNLTKPSYTPNTIYKNIVCCDDGSVVLYEKQHIHKRTGHKGEEKETLIFYYGLNDIHAVSIPRKRKIFACPTFSEGEIIADKYLLNLLDLSKFRNLDITKRIYTIDQLKEMYIEICNPCDEGVAKFLQDINKDSTKKYSIKDLLLLLPKFAKYSDYFLFDEVFAKQLEKSKKEKYFIIN